MRRIKAVALSDDYESRLLDFMSHDMVSHFYAIYDLQHLRENTLTWIALSDDEILFEPGAPADKMTEGQITAFVTMKATRQSFRPEIHHIVQELKRKSAPELADLLGINPEQATDFFRGFAFGLFKGGKLVSYAASPEILDDLAIVRGVFTAPEERNKGYSKSVCSVLVGKLLDEGRDVILYVSKDNSAAIEVYRKIGFKETGHLFLGFAARRKH